MAKVEIYVRERCPYCHNAKKLLTARGATYEEIDLDAHPERTDEMVERSGGRRTVPEIFIDGLLIGGFDQLAALDAKGELASLLAG